MMLAFSHFLTYFNRCVKLYWHEITSSWNMKGIQTDPSPQKNYPQKIQSY